MKEEEKYFWNFCDVIEGIESFFEGNEKESFRVWIRVRFYDRSKALKFLFKHNFDIF
jgi:hypothetical protein